MTSPAAIVIVVDATGARLPATALELLGAAGQIASRSTASVQAIVFAGCGEALARDLFAHGADCVYRAPIPEEAHDVAEARLPALVDVCRRVAPRLVLFAHGVIGAELAPRLAFRLGGAVATGCIDIAMDGDAACCTRPCYGGVAREVDRFEAAPLVATVRSGVFPPAARDAGRAGQLVEIARSASAPRTRLIARALDSREGVRLEDARAIVAGGRGLEGGEGFRLLEALARELGGAVGASRVPCDLGWCPHSWQIGLTGKTVSPDLYVAVGISGAGQHMAGCGNAKTIVAINTDPEAAIFQDARFGVIGDYREVVPALAAELRRLKQAS